ncbi:hypothetical protein BGZ61DRAFT_473606 [Ilyonectria robusta]|uniref:uncharacterized protein n=1 Tax=Ilyonectria robusta TaxID=1079257 RepID=UPI001E8CF1D1|nr:uncharacterized protein BGZ61DRAFT_473606 [Ilyonectria robusta]KAH8734948.1 hypothetical protein BGZ61DRAFT_473606 [Ilyonectria robusta]
MYSLGPNSPFDIAGSLADKRKADDLAVLSFAEDVVVSKRPRLETELAGGDISFEADMELDSNYPSGWSEKELPECVRISDRPREILDLLNSSNFEQHLESLRDYNRMPTTVPGLQTRLKLWQARGKEKLKVLAQFSFKGGLWNYDQRPTTVPGLQTTLRLWQARGKEKLKGMLPHCGFILIVCRKSCIAQWVDEIKKHFKREHRPSYIVLNSTKFPVRELLQYDIVITSLNSLRSQYQNCTSSDDYYEVDHVSGVKEADREFPAPPEELHSPLYSTRAVRHFTFLPAASQLTTENF